MIKSYDDPPSRRAFLATAFSSGLIGTAGCLNRVFESPSPPFGPVEHGWKMTGRDAANTAFNPGASGPRTEPEVVWKLDLRVNRTPRIVVEEDVLAVTMDETLYVFDLEHRELSWKTDVSARFHTPALASKRVYVRTTETEVTAFDAKSGEPVWVFNQFGDMTPDNFVYPVLHDDVVIVAAANGTVSALDAGDGSKQWSTNLDVTSGLYLAVAGDLVCVSSEYGVAILDAEDGTILYQSERGGIPTMVNDTVYIVSQGVRVIRADGTVGWLIEPRRGVHSPLTVANDRVYLTNDGVSAWDVRSGELLWSTWMGSGRPVVDSRTLFVGSKYYRRSVFGIDSFDGTLLWERSIPEAPGHLRIVDDLLFVGTATGELLVLAEP